MDWDEGPIVPPVQVQDSHYPVLCCVLVAFLRTRAVPFFFSGLSLRFLLFSSYTPGGAPSLPSALTFFGFRGSSYFSSPFLVGVLLFSAFFFVRFLFDFPMVRFILE